MQRMYTLYDRVAQAHFAPFCAANDPAASRSVATAAIMDNTIVGQHPNDFDLFGIATFDDQTGVVTPYAAPVLIQRVALLVNLMRSPDGEGSK